MGDGMTLFGELTAVTREGVEDVMEAMQEAVVFSLMKWIDGREAHPSLNLKAFYVQVLANSDLMMLADTLKEELNTLGIDLSADYLGACELRKQHDRMATVVRWLGMFQSEMLVRGLIDFEVGADGQFRFV